MKEKTTRGRVYVYTKRPGGKKWTVRTGPIADTGYFTLEEGRRLPPQTEDVAFANMEALAAMFRAQGLEVKLETSYWSV